MYVLGVGRRAFNNYVSLKSIVKPFETTKAKMLHRLFLFRGPQHKKDFVLTKAVLKVGKASLLMLSILPCNVR